MNTSSLLIRAISYSAQAPTTKNNSACSSSLVPSVVAAKTLSLVLAKRAIQDHANDRIELPFLFAVASPAAARITRITFSQTRKPKKFSVDADFVRAVTANVPYVQEIVFDCSCSDKKSHFDDLADNVADVLLTLPNLRHVSFPDEESCNCKLLTVTALQTLITKHPSMALRRCIADEIARDQQLLSKFQRWTDDDDDSVRHDLIFGTLLRLVGVAPVEKKKKKSAPAAKAPKGKKAAAAAAAAAESETVPVAESDQQQQQQPNDAHDDDANVSTAQPVQLDDETTCSILSAVHALVMGSDSATVHAAEAQALFPRLSAFIASPSSSIKLRQCAASLWAAVMSHNLSKIRTRPQDVRRMGEIASESGILAVVVAVLQSLIAEHVPTITALLEQLNEDSAAAADANKNEEEDGNNSSKKSDSDHDDPFSAVASASKKKQHSSDDEDEEDQDDDAAESHQDDDDDEDEDEDENENVVVKSEKSEAEDDDDVDSEADLDESEIRNIDPAPQFIDPNCIFIRDVIAAFNFTSNSITFDNNGQEITVFDGEIEQALFAAGLSKCLVELLTGRELFFTYLNARLPGGAAGTRLRLECEQIVAWLTVELAHKDATLELGYIRAKALPVLDDWVGERAMRVGILRHDNNFSAHKTFKHKSLGHDWIPVALKLHAACALFRFGDVDDASLAECQQLRGYAKLVLGDDNRGGEKPELDLMQAVKHLLISVANFPAAEAPKIRQPTLRRAADSSRGHATRTQLRAEQLEFAHATRAVADVMDCLASAARAEDRVLRAHAAAKRVADRRSEREANSSSSGKEDDDDDADNKSSSSSSDDEDSSTAKADGKIMYPVGSTVPEYPPRCYALELLYDPQVLSSLLSIRNKQEELESRASELIERLNDDVVEAAEDTLESNMSDRDDDDDDDSEPNEDDYDPDWKRRLGYLPTDSEDDEEEDDEEEYSAPKKKKSAKKASSKKAKAAPKKKASKKVKAAPKKKKSSAKAKAAPKKKKSSAKASSAKKKSPAKKAAKKAAKKSAKAAPKKKAASTKKASAKKAGGKSKKK